MRVLKTYRLSFLKKPTNIRKGNLGQPIYETGLSKVIEEIFLLSNLNHPNIMRLFRVVEVPDKDKLHLVVQYAEDGQLLTWSPNGGNCFTVNPAIGNGNLSMETLKQIFRAMANGIGMRTLISTREKHSA